MAEDWSEKIAGLKPASFTVAGTFDEADVARIFDVPKSLLNMAVHAPDGCVLLKGPIARSSYTAGQFDGELEGLEYDGRLPNGKHIHTLPWYRRKRFRRISDRWSSFRLRLGSWIAGVDREDW